LGLENAVVHGLDLQGKVSQHFPSGGLINRLIAQHHMALMQVAACNQKRVKRKTYNNRHFDVKLAPEFFDARLIICITFPDGPGEVSIQVISFKIWSLLEY
jgi:hypothetical protein